MYPRKSKTIVYSRNLFGWLSVLLLAACASLTHAQPENDAAKRVLSISISSSGLLSNAAIISNLYTREGVLFDEKKWAEDISALQRLPQIKSVTHSVLSTDKGFRLLLEIQERGAFLQVFNLRYFTPYNLVQLGVTHTALGKTTASAGGYWFFNGKNGFGFFGDSPYFGKGRFRLSAQWYKDPSLEPLGKRLINDHWNISERVSVGLGYFPRINIGAATISFGRLIENSEKAYRRLSNPAGRAYTLSDRQWEMGVRHSINRLDQRNGRLWGWDIRTVVAYRTGKNTLGAKWEYSQFFSYCLPVMPRLDVAVRCNISLSPKQGNPFSPFWAQYTHNLSSLGFRFDRGFQRLALGGELRKMIFENSKGNLQAVFFTDWTSISKTNNEEEVFWEGNSFSGLSARLCLFAMDKMIVRADLGVDTRSFSKVKTYLGFNYPF